MTNVIFNLKKLCFVFKYHFSNYILEHEESEQQSSETPSPLTDAPDSSFRPASCIPVIRIMSDKKSDFNIPVIRILPPESAPGALTRRQSSPGSLMVPDCGTNGR
jgi:hypothetical protein